MTFDEIIKRLTGFSTPIFGVSWNPPESDRVIAKRIITELEDRRVLTAPRELEAPEFCIKSVIEIRHILTKEIGELDSDSQLAKSLRGMRASMRRFLDFMQEEPDDIQFNPRANFFRAVGELRAVVGIHTAQIAAQYGLDVESDLANILPSEDNFDET